jgi:hypothetical protein
VSNITNVNLSSEFRITIYGDGESLDLFSCAFQREKGKRKTETVIRRRNRRRNKNRDQRKRKKKTGR